MVMVPNQAISRSDNRRMNDKELEPGRHTVYLQFAQAKRWWAEYDDYPFDDDEDRDDQPSFNIKLKLTRMEEENDGLLDWIGLF